jgi:hypothetical protein
MAVAWGQVVVIWGRWVLRMPWLMSDRVLGASWVAASVRFAELVSCTGRGRGEAWSEVRGGVEWSAISESHRSTDEHMVHRPAARAGSGA